MGWYYDYEPYVPVAQRRAQAAREVARRMKKGEAASPVRDVGRKIVSTFWGQAWCTNLESYSDFANRLPRGRTYVRNGSVVHLKITAGQIEAYVSGSELYTVEIQIAALPKNTWQAVKATCAGKIGSLVELLQGKLSNAVMAAVTDRTAGLFPKPKEIMMECSCPDYAGMCKHIAAVMYGIGNRLDSKPELLFALRGVDHQELIEQAIPAAPVRVNASAPVIESTELGDIFGIEVNAPPPAEPAHSKAVAAKKTPKVKKPPAATRPAVVKKATAKKTVAKKTAKKKKGAKESKSVPRKKNNATNRSAATKKRAMAVTGSD